MSERILIISNFFSETGGIRHACEDLADQLALQGWSAIRTSKKIARVPRLIDIVSTILSQRKAYDVAQVDVYSDLAFGLAEIICATLRLVGKPYVLTLRGGNLPAFAQRWPRRVSRLLSSAAIVTIPSRYLYEAMKKYRKELVLIPNSLDLTMYPFRLRTKLNPNLIWLRSLHKIYNPVLAVQTAGILVEEFPGLYLTMVGPDNGDGSYQAVEKEAERLGIRKRLLLTGTVAKADVPDWLAHGDIFLNTTNVDNTPVSVMEAMACGLCVVSTNVGGIPYLLDHEQDALLVPPDDPIAMATAVRRLLETPWLAQKLSGGARHKAERLDWHAILPQWEIILKRTLGSKTF